MKKIREVKIGGIKIGGDNPVAIQSMLSVSSDDIKGNVAQAVALEKAGCEIIRFALPSIDDCVLIGEIKKAVSVPLVADIHFDYRIALKAIECGIDKIRINPGNIGDISRVREVVSACKDRNIPIRIGVNGGSLEKDILAEFGRPTAQAMVKSAMRHVKILQNENFHDIVVSIKTSDVLVMIEAYRLMRERVDYPLHLGVTEAGTERMGLIKSAVGIGALLADGIGETIRVSLTADPVLEIAAAKDILRALGIRSFGPTMISCPTCGRTEIGLVELAEKVEKRLSSYKKSFKVAVMGCFVNGPGEAKEADYGIAGGRGLGVVFKKGKVVLKVAENELIDALFKVIDEDARG